MFIEQLALTFAESFGDPEIKEGAEVVEATNAVLATPQGQRLWAAIQAFETAFNSGAIALAKQQKIAAAQQKEQTAAPASYPGAHGGSMYQGPETTE
jgi:hypothetical protein